MLLALTLGDLTVWGVCGACFAAGLFCMFMALFLLVLCMKGVD